jgi:ferredoxin
MSYRLRVNPITCDGHGVCAELLPEVLRMDPWGYPMVPAGALPSELVAHARRAAAACPTLALLIEKAPPENAPPARR